MAIWGVKVSHFEAFIVANGGRNTLHNHKTRDIVQLIRAVTGEKSYCEHMQSDSISSSAIGVASTFIVHKWDDNFIQVVDILQYYFKDRMDTIVWFDLFSNNQQNPLSIYDPRGKYETFHSITKSMSHAVLVTSTFHHCILIYQNAWCAFHIYLLNKNKKCTFDIAMSQEELKMFYSNLDFDQNYSFYSDFSVGDLFHHMKMESKIKDCYSPDDPKEILAFLHNDCAKPSDLLTYNHGYAAIVQDRLKEWLVFVISRELTRRREQFARNEIQEKELLLYVTKLAGAYNFTYLTPSILPFETVESLYREAVERSSTVFGPDHVNTLAILTRFSECYSFYQQNNKNRENGEKIITECMNKCKQVLGPDSEYTNKAVCRFICYMCTTTDPNKLEIVEKAYQYLLDNSIRKFGVISEEATGALNDLRIFYRSCKHDKVAERQCHLELLAAYRQRQDGDRVVKFIWDNYYNKPKIKVNMSELRRDYELVVSALTDVTHYEKCDETVIGDAKYTLASIYYKMGTYYLLTHSLTYSLTHAYSLTYLLTHAHNEQVILTQQNAFSRS